MRISDWSSDVCSADLGAEHHSRTIFKLWQWRTMGDGMIDADWFARRLTRYDETDGDIDQLASRIAAVRTLCFIAQSGDWIADAAGWPQRQLDLDNSNRKSVVKGKRVSVGVDRGGRCFI